MEVNDLSVQAALTKWQSLFDNWNDQLHCSDERAAFAVDCTTGDMETARVMITHVGDEALAEPKRVTQLIYREDYYLDVVCEDGTRFARCYPRDFNDGRTHVEARSHQVGAGPFLIDVQFNYAMEPTT